MSNKKLLIPFYHNNKNIIEIGIDEAGRGPLFGRVYCAGVVFPNNIDLNFSQIKDSKKFTSQKKLNEAKMKVETIQSSGESNVIPNRLTSFDPD